MMPCMIQDLIRFQISGNSIHDYIVWDSVIYNEMIKMVPDDIENASCQNYICLIVFFIWCFDLKQKQIKIFKLVYLIYKMIDHLLSNKIMRRYSGITLYRDK